MFATCRPNTLQDIEECPLQVLAVIRMFICISEPQSQHLQKKEVAKTSDTHHPPNSSNGTRGTTSETEQGGLRLGEEIFFQQF